MTRPRAAPLAALRPLNLLKWEIIFAPQKTYPFFRRCHLHEPIGLLACWFDTRLAAEDERIALAAEADDIIDSDYTARLIALLTRIEAHYEMSDDERAVVDWVCDQLPDDAA